MKDGNVFHLLSTESQSNEGLVNPFQLTSNKTLLDNWDLTI